MTKPKKQRTRGTAEQAAAIQRYIKKFAKNPLITFSDIAELLNVSPQYVRQVASAVPGLLKQREADRKKYFSYMLRQIEIPE
jgi:hypothetical protein